MPVDIGSWFAFIQALLPMAQTLAEMLKNNPPPASATPEQKALHTDLVASLEKVKSAHGKMTA
jgi:hypothetical protein